MDSTDCIIIGGGVIGLAIARRLSAHGLEVLIVERAGGIGTETSSRNSEVIHAGLYYPPGSLKAELCIRGRALLYDYAERTSIPFQRCGKLIVATARAQEGNLANIISRAELCCVRDLKLLSAREARTFEPEVVCAAALLSPSSGIIDSHQLMLRMLGEAETQGAMLCLNTAVSEVHVTEQGFDVGTIDHDGTPFRLRTRVLINAAGLWASDVARRIRGLDSHFIPATLLARGTYFGLTGRSPFSHLVYPLPEPGGLGVHLTIDLAGQMRFGPDVEWIDSVDYHVNQNKLAHFEHEIQKYWPGLPLGVLQATYCGIRPKLSGPGDAPADFRIDGPEQHGIAGLVNLFGIESPGLTSSLAIGERVESLLVEYL